MSAPKMSEEESATEALTSAREEDPPSCPWSLENSPVAKATSWENSFAPAESAPPSIVNNDWIHKWAEDWGEFVRGEQASEYDEYLAQRTLLALADLESRSKAALNLRLQRLDTKSVGSGAMVTFISSKRSAVKLRKGELVEVVEMPQEIDKPIGLNIGGLKGSVREHVGDKLTISVDPKVVDKWSKMRGNITYAAVIDYSNVIYLKRNETLEEMVAALRDEKNDRHRLAMYLTGRLLPDMDCPVETLPSAPLSKLNTAQKEAVEFCVSGRRLCTLQGPPGTGKTTVVTALIKALVTMEKKVLACAPAHIAVDNMCDRVRNMKSLRLGNAAKIDEASMDKTLTERVRRSTQLNEEMLDRQLLQLENDPSLSASKREYIQRMAKRDLKVARKFENRRQIQNAEIVFCTCSGANSTDLQDISRERRNWFDYVIVDEAGQVLILDAWPAIKLGERIILVGDPKQLPATIKNKEMAKRIGDSLLGSLMRNKEFAQGYSKLLSLQYRMLPEIMLWSSSQFYNKKLEADESVRKLKLPPSIKSLVWIDTKVLGRYAHEKCRSRHHEVPSFVNDDEWKRQFEKANIVSEEDQKFRIEELVKMLDERSISNSVEAMIVLKYMEKLRREVWVNIDSIGVICMYAAQAVAVDEYISARAEPALRTQTKVATVDGFQGRERDVIILSLVRSNNAKPARIGFLDDARRINVAATRAKKHIVVIGDSSTVCDSHTIETLYDYIGSIPDGVIEPATNYVTIQELTGNSTRDSPNKTTLPAQPPPTRVRTLDYFIDILKKVTPTSGPKKIGEVYTHEYRQIRKYAPRLNLTITCEPLNNPRDDRVMAIATYGTPPPSSSSRHRSVERRRRRRRKASSSSSDGA